jgi:protein-tyrosine phosphatase
MQSLSEEHVLGALDGPTEMIPGCLWQGPWPDDLNLIVEKLRLDLIVNLEFAQHDPFRQSSRPFDTIWFPIHDSNRLPELRKLHRVSGCVTERIKAGQRVLVHCAAGLNRSGLVTALVVRQYYGINGASAVDLLRSKRPWALCNPTFAEYVASLKEPRNRGPHSHYLSSTIG